MPSSPCQVASAPWTRSSRLPRSFHTNKIKDFPLVLMGREYWDPLMDFFARPLLRTGTIDPLDYDRILGNDSPEEAVGSITRVAAGPVRADLWSAGETALVLGRINSAHTRLSIVR